MPDLSPDDVAGREFRTSFRGYEPTEVRSFLAEVASGLGSLLSELERLQVVGATSQRNDVKAEIDTVSAEVHSVLRTAHEAAESMRERASHDATRWRSEAVAEVESVRKQAAVDAEALRSDAWTMSEQLLQQCQVEAQRVVEDAQKEALRVVGEAERESHRLQAGARRESEDLLRAARMEAEQLHAEARARHDEMIQDAIRQSESAQERTLALEKRRQELLTELDSVRATLTQVEDALDQRRERLGLSAASDAVGKIVTKDHTEPPSGGDQPDDETWTPGETVRVVRPSRPGETQGPTEVTSHPPQPEVKVFSGQQFARIKAGLDPDAGDGEPDDDERPDHDQPDHNRPDQSEPDLEHGATADEEAAGLLDQREEANSTSVRLVDSPKSPARRPERPEPESLEPGDIVGPVTPHEPELEPGIPDEESEPDDDVESEPVADVPPAALVEPDEASEAQGRSAVPEPEKDAVVTQLEPEQNADVAAPGPERHRYSFGDHVVVTGPPPQDPSSGGRPPSPAVGEEPAADEEDQQTLFGEVAGLFDRLRVGPAEHASRSGSESDDRSSEVESMVSRRLTTAVVDAFEVRDRLLLPVGNRALRNLKRQLTEAQNVALEEVRLDESGWEPDADALRERLGADLVVLFAESFGAGHAAAEEMLGGHVPRPATPRDDVAEPFVGALMEDLLQVLSEGRTSGQGARQLGAALSRVFRGWRTDQAERRVRDLSLTGYHQGLLRSFELTDGPELEWKVAGRGCATCRAAHEERPDGLVPPAHPGCECAIGP